jgi:hypothetical protein
MSSEFFVLREAWLALDEPSEDVRADARARLYEEIALEQSELLARPREKERDRSGLRLHSRLAIVVVLGLVLLLTWATLTLAFGWHVIFGSAQRASHNSRIFEDFNTLDVGAPKGMASGVMPNQTRLVATFGRYRLWVAPTRAGGFCSMTVGGPLGSGGCERLGTIPLGVGYGMIGRFRGGNSPRDDLADLREVDGFVDPRWSESVEIRFEDGTVIRPRIVWVSEPIAHGFYYQPIGSEHRRAGHRLREVVALDADGNIVGRDDMLRRSYAGGPPAGAVVDRAEVVARLDTPFGEAVLWNAPSRFETSCTWLELAERFHGSCQFEGYSSRWHGELVRRANVVLFYGAGIPSAGSVRLDFADGHHLRLRPDSDGFLLSRVAPSARARPTSYTVVAAGGTTLLHSPLWLPPDER